MYGKFCFKEQGQGTKYSNIAIETHLNIELFPVTVCYFRRLTCGSHMQSLPHGNEDWESALSIMQLSDSICFSWMI